MLLASIQAAVRKHGLARFVFRPGSHPISMARTTRYDPPRDDKAMTLRSGRPDLAIPPPVFSRSGRGSILHAACRFPTSAWLHAATGGKETKEALPPQKIGWWFPIAR